MNVPSFLTLHQRNSFSSVPACLRSCMSVRGSPHRSIIPKVKEPCESSVDCEGRFTVRLTVFNPSWSYKKCQRVWSVEVSLFIRTIAIVLPFQVEIVGEKMFEFVWWKGVSSLRRCSLHFLLISSLGRWLWADVLPLRRSWIQPASKLNSYRNGGNRWTIFYSRAKCLKRVATLNAQERNVGFLHEVLSEKLHAARYR